MKKTVKKVLAVVLAAALITGCIAITAFAVATEPEWTCTGAFTKTSQEAGTYTFMPTGTGNKYYASGDGLGLDVTSVLRDVLKDNEKVTLKVSFDYTITPAEGKTASVADFMLCAKPGNAEYEGTYFEKASGVYRAKVRGPLTADGSKHSYTNEITVTKADIEPFDKLELTFWRIDCSTVESLSFSNTSVAVLNENTLVWEKGHAPAHPTFYNDENGDVVFRQTAPTAGYRTLQCNLVSKLKELRGGLNEAAVKITFSFRADLIDTNVKVTGHVTARTVGSYSGNILNGTNNAMLKDEYQKKNCPITGEWQTVSITIPVTEKETSLNSFGLCFSGITNIGNISAIEYKNAKVETTSMLKSQQVSVGEDLTLNCTAIVNGDTNAFSARFTRNGKTVTDNGTAEGNKMTFTYAGITPQCMTDTVIVELLQGEDVVESKTFSVKSYCEKVYQLNPDARTLVAALLSYGAAAQKYAGYKTDNPANVSKVVSFDGLQPVKPEDGIRNVDEIGADDNNRVMAATVYFDSVIKIRFKVSAEEKVLVDGKIVAPENGYVYTSGIKATGFADEHTVEVVKGTNTVSKVTYNVNAYIAQKWDSENMKNLVQALACFGAAAKAYK